MLHSLIFPNSLVVFHHHVDEGGGIQRFAIQIELEHLGEGATGQWESAVSPLNSGRNTLSAAKAESA